MRHKKKGATRRTIPLDDEHVIAVWEKPRAQTPRALTRVRLDVHDPASPTRLISGRPGRQTAALRQLRQYYPHAGVVG